MHPRSTRFRLTLWFSLVLALGLAIFGGFVWIAMRQRLYADIDSGLQSRGWALKDFVLSEARDKPSDLHDEISEFARALPYEYGIRVSTSDGTTLFEHEPPKVIANYRTFTQSISAEGRQFNLLLSDSTAHADTVISQLGMLLFSAIPGVVLIAAIGGYLLSSRALTPVDAMTRAARSIGIDNLSERLPVPASDDEIQRLAETWNAMLSRLEGAVTRISQFTSDASHELRTPIALIRSTAEIALRRPRSDFHYRESLHQIEVEAQRMTQLVDDLLFLARADAHAAFSNMEPVNLRTVVESVCEEMSPLAVVKGVSLRSTAADAELELTGRESALRRMLVALVDNALKYTPEGGEVVLSVEEADGQYRVSIRDTGIGIPEEVLPHIFERFYRADVSRSRDSGGHGLGLSIAQTIARQHNGVIVANSRLGSGSEFRVMLPASNAW
jgi:two-component system heavy metal sensor histidine kinase CusS